MKELGNPMHLSPRCGAHARTTRLPCRAPAVRGCQRCRMHGARAGRPATHGRYSREAVEAQRQARALLASLHGLIKRK